MSVFQPTLAAQLSVPLPRTLVEGDEWVPRITSSEVRLMTSAADCPILGAPEMVEKLHRQLCEGPEALLTDVCKRESVEVACRVRGAVTCDEDIAAIHQVIGNVSGLLYRYMLLGKDGFPGCVEHPSHFRVTLPALGLTVAIASRFEPYAAAEHAADFSILIEPLTAAFPDAVVMNSEGQPVEGFSRVGITIGSVSTGDAVFLFLVPDAKAEKFTEAALQLQLPTGVPVAVQPIDGAP